MLTLPLKSQCRTKYFSAGPAQFPYLANTRLHQRIRELHWIKELCTIAHCDCNEQIKDVGTLSSPSHRSTNVFGIFDKQSCQKDAMDTATMTKKLLSRVQE